MRCCIDENDNNICDEDELSGNVLVCEKPYCAPHGHMSYPSKIAYRM
jgi:hypothetical protein